MINQDGIYLCDYCKNTIGSGEYFTDTGNHVTCQTIAELEAQLAEAVEVIKPFAHPDLVKTLSGNVIGNDSIIFQRDNAKLTLGDTRRAAEFLKKLEDTPA